MDSEFHEIYTEKAKHLLRLKHDRKYFQKNRVVFYGTGILAQSVAPINFNDCKINVVAFADSYKSGNIELSMGQYSKSFPIISVEDLKQGHEYADCLIVICVSNDCISQEIKELLLRSGISSARIFCYPVFKKIRSLISLSNINEALCLTEYKKGYDFFSHDKVSQDIILSLALLRCGYDVEVLHSQQTMQYFEVLEYSKNEIFVDGGFFTGDTLRSYIRNLGNCFKKYYGFELDNRNLMRYENANDRVEVVSKGLWSKEVTVYLSQRSGSTSHMNEVGEHKAEVISLDYFFSNADSGEYPTTIKLDIEGAEKEALTGAKLIIGKAKPKLAISVYHKLKDIYELPQIILSINKDYKMVLRHYSEGLTETVLYAW